MEPKRFSALIAKEFTIFRRSRSLVGSLLSPTLIISVVLPLILLGRGPLAQAPGTVGGWISTFIKRMPAALQAEMIGLTSTQTLIYATAVYYVLPFFILQAAAAAVATGAEGFVREKTHGTFDSLLYTPVTDLELLVAKVVTCFLPPVITGWVAFAVYTLMVNWVSWPVMGRVFFPPSLWIAFEFVLIPLISLTVTLISLAASLKMRNPADVGQVGNMVLAPVALLFFGQALGYWYAGKQFLSYFAIVIVLADFGLLALARKLFVRGRLAERV